MERRTDYKSALHIETAIHDATTHGLPSAARKLAGLGVPLEVSMRVLTRPEERRHQAPSIDVSIAPISDRASDGGPALPGNITS
jgi:hypothetical protein